MQHPSTEEYFGLAIAYLLPGTTLLLGLSYVSPTVEGWLATSPTAPASFAGFLFSTVAGIKIGLFVHGFRTLALDRVLYPLTGLKRPLWREEKLNEKILAFNKLVENEFRYHQLWGGMCLALFAVLVLRRLSQSQFSWSIDPSEWIVLGLIPLCCYLSRTALRSYYNRTSALLGTTIAPPKESEKKMGGHAFSNYMPLINSPQGLPGQKPKTSKSSKPDKQSMRPATQIKKTPHSSNRI